MPRHTPTSVPRHHHHQHTHTRSRTTSAACPVSSACCSCCSAVCCLRVRCDTTARRMGLQHAELCTSEAACMACTMRVQAMARAPVIGCRCRGRICVANSSSRGGGGRRGTAHVRGEQRTRSPAAARTGHAGRHTHASHAHAAAPRARPLTAGQHSEPLKLSAQHDTGARDLYVKVPRLVAGSASSGGGGARRDGAAAAVGHVSCSHAPRGGVTGCRCAERARSHTQAPERTHTHT
jgi:hypothetical protein